MSRGTQKMKRCDIRGVTISVGNCKHCLWANVRRKTTETADGLIVGLSVSINRLCKYRKYDKCAYRQSLKYDRCKPVHPKPLQRAKKECQPVGQHPDLRKNGKFVYYTAPAVRQVVAGVAVCVCLTATAEYRLQTVQRQNKTLQHFFWGGAFSYQPLPVCNRHNVKKRIFNAF